MNLRQRLDELKRMRDAAQYSPFLSKDKDAFCDLAMDTIGPLLEVVEAQHRALEESWNYINCGNFSAGFDKRILSALALMDKEES